ATKLPPQSVACALQALHLLDVDVDSLPVEQLLTNLVVPGRFQHICIEGKDLIIDVAHNPAASERLAQMIKATFGGRRIIGIFAVMEDKDITGVVKPLKEIVDLWILPELTGVNRAAKPQHLQTLLYNATLA